KQLKCFKCGKTGHISPKCRNIKTENIKTENIKYEKKYEPRMCEEKVLIDDSIFTHTFHIVPNDFPITMDGILGYDFLVNNQMIFDCSNNCLITKEVKTENLKVKTEELKTEVKNKEKLKIIKARSISYLRVEIDSKITEGIISKVKLGHGLTMSDSL
ncbi:unnamed protein product, partial [Diamesa tonsa]